MFKYITTAMLAMVLSVSLFGAKEPAAAAKACPKAAAAKEYAAKKGMVEEEEPENLPMSGIAERPYCKGRAYDPDRYAPDSTEE